MARSITAQNDNSNNDEARILIADRTRMASQLLADVLARIGRYRVKAVGSPSEVLGIIESADPHIAVISADVQAGPTKGIETVAELHKLYPHVLVIVLVDAANRDIVIQAFRAGARGVFCRSEAVSVFAKCVKSVHLGQIWAGPTEMEFMLEAIIATTPPRVVDAFGVDLLSSRELEVAGQAAEGRTNREIAQLLKLSEHTVKNYIFRACEKLGLSNRVELLFYILSRRGLGPIGATVAPSRSTTPMHEYQQAAEEGSPYAQYMLALCYRDGLYTEKNSSLALFWLRCALESGVELSHKVRTALEQLPETRVGSEMEELTVQAAEQQQTGHATSKPSLSPAIPRLPKQVSDGSAPIRKSA